eukprot:COSAG02_NODE_5015_length_4723_cov_3.671064_5_plen_187_part_00
MRQPRLSWPWFSSRSSTSSPAAACSHARSPCCALRAPAMPGEEKSLARSGASSWHTVTKRKRALLRTILQLGFLQVLEQVLVARRRLVVCTGSRATSVAELQRLLPRCGTSGVDVPMAGLIWLSRMRCSCWQRSTQRWLHILLFTGRDRFVCLCPENIVVPRLPAPSAIPTPTPFSRVARRGSTVI